MTEADDAHARASSRSALPRISRAISRESLRRRVAYISVVNALPHCITYQVKSLVTAPPRSLYRLKRNRLSAATGKSRQRLPRPLPPALVDAFQLCAALRRHDDMVAGLQYFSTTYRFSRRDIHFRGR